MDIKKKLKYLGTFSLRIKDWPLIGTGMGHETCRERHIYLFHFFSYKAAPEHFVYAALGMRTRTLCILGKPSAKGPTISAQKSILI